MVWLYCQSVAALGASCAQYIAPILGGHAFAKTMHSMVTSVFGLVSPFHLL